MDGGWIHRAILIGAAAVPPYEDRKEDFLAANEQRKVRPLRLDLINHIEEARHVAAAVLDSGNSWAVQSEATDDFDRDLIGKLGNVVQDDVNRTPLCEFAEVVLNAFGSDFIEVGAGDRITFHFDGSISSRPSK